MKVDKNYIYICTHVYYMGTANVKENCLCAAQHETKNTKIQIMMHPPPSFTDSLHHSQPQNPNLEQAYIIN